MTAGPAPDFTASGSLRIIYREISRIVALGLAAGAVYGYFAAANAGGSGVEGIVRGIATGGFITLILTPLELAAVRSAGFAFFRRLPFPIHVAIKTAVYLAVILLGLYLGFALFQDTRTVRPAPIVTLDVIYSLVIAFVVNFQSDVNRLLGQNVLFSFITGRYHRPRQEERVFLIIDMIGSTAAAEKLGDVGFHRLLNRFVSDLAEPIAAYKGDIYKYVGDEVIVTWPKARGLEGARCVRACFAAYGALATQAAGYQKTFGIVPYFRAGIHAGPVVAGEMGSVKKEIALLGDALNTAVRIQEACRETGKRVLVSDAVLDAIDLPPGIVKQPIGAVRLRGKARDVALFALDLAAKSPAG